MRLELIKKDDIKNLIKQQSKLTFNGNHKSFEKYYSYTFKNNEVVMDKAIYNGFAILELSKLHMYETDYDKLQPYFGQEIFHQDGDEWKHNLIPIEISKTESDNVIDFII